MTRWIKLLKTRKWLRYFILLVLFWIIYIFPQHPIYTEVAYIILMFFVIYLAAYIENASVWKGLLYTLLLTVIVIAVFLTTITLLPNIPYVLLLFIVVVAAGVSRYFIG